MSGDSGDRVTDAVAELYAADPADFTARRKELAAAARDAGDKDAAKRITALRKPTRAAWAVNTLARADTGAPERLAALASELRAATMAKDGRRLRDLSARRGPLIDDLTGQALATAGITDAPPTLRAEVAETLTSALAEPETARQFAAGTLTRAAQWAGFEGAPADDFPAGFAAAAPEPVSPVPLSPAEQARTVAPPAKTGASSRAGVADEVAAQRRQAFLAAERSMATAADAAAAAVAREDELEAEVRNLEDRLTRARAELADARTRARRSESAERKARQALDRLQPPPPPPPRA